MSNPVVAHGVDSGVCRPLALSFISNSCLLREGLQIILAPYISFHLSRLYSAVPLPDPSVAHPENHVALIDSRIGKALAEQWTRYWRSCLPPARVILFELVNDIEVIVSSIESGISGYALENATPRELAETIRLASEGCALCSPEVTAQLFARLARTPSSKSNTLELQLLLTAREYEVLSYVVKGYSNKEIATLLVIEQRTVKQHVNNIFAKLNWPKPPCTA
jgi:DNA-binding NarL/FixJ family response regulator